MLADLFVWVNGHYLTLLLVMLAGACFVLACMLFIFIVRRRDVLLGEPDVPTVVEPADTGIRSIVQPQPNYHRSDDDTRVIPRIPGATPQPPAELAPELKAVQRYLAVVDAEPQPIVGLRQERIEEAPTEAIEPTEDAPRDEPTPVIDLCPLTTQDIAIPKDGRLPDYEAAGGTRDLTAARAKFREEERVA